MFLYNSNGEDSKPICDMCYFPYDRNRKCLTPSEWQSPNQWVVRRYVRLLYWYIDTETLSGLCWMFSCSLRTNFHTMSICCRWFLDLPLLLVSSIVVHPNKNFIPQRRDGGKEFANMYDIWETSEKSGIIWSLVFNKERSLFLFCIILTFP